MEFDIYNPYKEFDEYIRESQEPERILFSAAFGSGKTFFLRRYFEREKYYAPVHIYPVNYSVVENKDVFELLKFDILCELLTRYPLDDESLKFSDLEIAKYLLLNKPIEVFASFAKAIPKIGRPINAFLESLTKWRTELIQLKAEVEQDDKQKILRRLEDMRHTVGGILEHDWVTQFIQNYLANITKGKRKNHVETVLIIDDLDRLDPDHIFRLLNLFAAHFDKDANGNKFGFDKIIMVADIQNVESIFAHRYGESADFNGYINKFYSLPTFYYSLKDSIGFAVNAILDQFLTPFDSKSQLFSHRNFTITRFATYILVNLVESDQLTVRQILWALKSPIRITYQEVIRTELVTATTENFYFTPISHLLLHIFGSVDGLLEAIGNSNEILLTDYQPGDRKRFIEICLSFICFRGSYKFYGVPGQSSFKHDVQEVEYLFNLYEKDITNKNGESVSIYECEITQQAKDNRVLEDYFVFDALEEAIETMEQFL